MFTFDLITASIGDSGSFPENSIPGKGYVSLDTVALLDQTPFKTHEGLTKTDTIQGQIQQLGVSFVQKAA